MHAHPALCPTPLMTIPYVRTDLNNHDGKSNIEGNSLEDFTHSKSSSPANSCRTFLLPLHCQAPQTQSPWIGISLPWKASSLSTFKQTSILEFLH